MNTIKFKVWDIVNKCFLEEFRNETGASNLYRLPIDKAILRYERPPNKLYPYPHLNLSHILSNLDFYKPLQFTGFLDVDEKEIYDGDIVSHDSGRISNGKYGSVIWALGAWMIQDNETAPDMGVFNNCKHLKVIGNIFEDAELLKIFV